VCIDKDAVARKADKREGTKLVTLEEKFEGNFKKICHVHVDIDLKRRYIEMRIHKYMYMIHIKCN
jgi:hypothetical protein